MSKTAAQLVGEQEPSMRQLISPRGEVVAVKGKGEMATYWLNMDPVLQVWVKSHFARPAFCTVCVHACTFVEERDNTEIAVVGIGGCM